MAFPSVFMGFPGCSMVFSMVFQGFLIHSQIAQPPAPATPSFVPMPHRPKGPRPPALGAVAAWTGKALAEWKRQAERREGNKFYSFLKFCFWSLVFEVGVLYNGLWCVFWKVLESPPLFNRSPQQAQRGKKPCSKMFFSQKLLRLKARQKKWNEVEGCWKAPPRESFTQRVLKSTP